MACVHRAEHQLSRGVPLSAPHRILSWFNSGGVACTHCICSAVIIVQLVAQLITNKKGLRIKYLNRTHAANGSVLKHVFALRYCVVFSSCTEEIPVSITAGLSEESHSTTSTSVHPSHSSGDRAAAGGMGKLLTAILPRVAES